MRVAIVGSGISGLGAGWLLSRRHEVHLFEGENRLGGHTHTHTIETSLGPKPIDSGFIVHNDRTYPNFIRLLDELGIEREASDMSWGVTGEQHRIEYSSRGVGGFFACRSRLLSPGHWNLLRDIVRFNREAAQLERDGKAESVTLGEFVEARRYGKLFRDYYLYPTVAAIWSTSPGRVLEFPAATLIRFFDNHGLLTLNGHPCWRVLRGGSSVYIEKLLRPFRENVRIGRKVVGVRREGGKVALQLDGEPEQWFDQVVLAVHGPQALGMLRDASMPEREVLSAFQVSTNEAVLHTDSSILPRRQAAWASWNYRIDNRDGAPATLTYDMNRLQNLETPERYLVTLNSTGLIQPERILKRMTYQHPLYTMEAVRAQARWAEISGVSGVHYCGAYWFNGFHEDGYRSALRVARSLGVECEIH